MKKFIAIFALMIAGTVATAQIDRSTMPEPGPAPSINLAEPAEFEMENGLTVLVVEDHKLPQVNISLTIDNPPIVEGEDAGVQSLTSSLLGKGTKKTSKDAFFEEVESLGANVSVYSSGAYAYTLSKYTDRIVELLAEAALMPQFSEEELELERKKLIEGLKSGDNSAAQIASRVRPALAYGTNHPAGEFATEETVNNVTLQDVQNFYRNNFVPGDAYMVISGDITPRKAKKLIKKHFSLWKAGTAPKFSYPDAEDVQYRQINFVDVPNAVQTELAVMNMTPLQMNDEDYHAALVANYVLGGAFGSYLNMKLREERGFTYGARSSIRTSTDYKTPFMAAAKVRNEVVDSAVMETLYEIERIRTEPVEDEMLDNAKAKYLGNFILSSEDNETVARRQISIMTNNLDKDFYKNFIEKINAVTKEDVQRVAQKYFNLDKARIVLVGKAADVVPNLEKLEWNGKPIPIFYYDKYANKTEKPVKSEIPEGVTAQTVLNDYIQALGGKQTLDKVNTLSYVASMDTPRGKLAMTVKRTQNDKWAQILEMGGQKLQEQYYQDGKGYSGGMGGGQELEGELLEVVKAEASFFPEAYNAKDAKLTGIEEVNGEKAYVIDWGNGIKKFYSVESGLLIAKESISKGPQGQDITAMEMFSDFKEVNGLMLPMQRSLSVMGQNLPLTVEEYKINEGVTGADFEWNK